MSTLLHATSVEAGLQKIDNSYILVLCLLLAFPLTLPILEVYRFPAVKNSFDSIYAKFKFRQTSLLCLKALRLCEMNTPFQKHPLLLRRHYDIMYHYLSSLYINLKKIPVGIRFRVKL